MARSTQIGIRSLSEQSQAILHRLLDQGSPPAAIARAIRDETGERATSTAITRYASGYRKRQAARQQVQRQTEALVARALQDGISVSELLRALLAERLTTAKKDGTAAKLDLLDLEEHERKRSEFELKERQAHFSNLYRQRDMELKERKTRLAEKQFRLQRERAKEHFAVLEQKASAGKRLTTDDVARIREIFGLYQPPAQQNQPGSQT